MRTIQSIRKCYIVLTGVALYLVITMLEKCRRLQGVSRNNVAMRLTKCENNVTVTVLQ